MKQYDDTNRGVLFVNYKKDKDTQPDYNGKINIDGKEVPISGWKKKSKKGEVFLSLMVDVKKGKPEVKAMTPSQAPAVRPAKPAPAADFDDDLNF